jgi:hypothetical protein
VRSDASFDEIRAAVDEHDKDNEDQEVRNACTTLIDPGLRSGYDAVLLLSDAVFGLAMRPFKARKVAVTPRQLLERATVEASDRVTVTLDPLALVSKTLDARTYRGTRGEPVEVTCVPSDNMYVDMESGEVHVEYFASLCELLAGGQVALGLPGDRLVQLELLPGGRTKNARFPDRGVDPGSDLYVHVLLMLPRSVPADVLQTHFRKGDPCDLIFKHS